MPHYLIVANQTLGDAHLVEEVKRRMDAGDCSFHLVVPASHPMGAWTEGQTHAAAEQRLAEALERFRAMGCQVTGEVGDASPVRAAGDAILASAQPFDEIVVSTLPLGVSRWVRQDVVHRMAVHQLPVAHVLADRVMAGARK